MSCTLSTASPKLSISGTRRASSLPYFSLEQTLISIWGNFRHRNDSFQSDIFFSDIRITDVDFGCRISLILRPMSTPTYGFYGIAAIHAVQIYYGHQRCTVQYIYAKIFINSFSRLLLTYFYNVHYNYHGLRITVLITSPLLSRPWRNFFYHGHNYCPTIVVIAEVHMFHGHHF